MDFILPRNAPRRPRPPHRHLNYQLGQTKPQSREDEIHVSDSPLPPCYFILHGMRDFRFSGQRDHDGHLERGLACHHVCTGSALQYQEGCWGEASSAPATDQHRARPSSSTSALEYPPRGRRPLKKNKRQKISLLVLFGDSGDF